MKGVKKDGNKRSVMINLHMVFPFNFTENHWINGGNQGDNAEWGSLPFTSYFNSEKRGIIAMQREEKT